MGILYEYGINPFNDVLIESLKYDVDISDRKRKPELSSIFIEILQNILNDEKLALYLDFDIVKKDGCYRVLGKNALTAFWLSGILIENLESEDVMFKNNVFIIGDRKYKYDKKKYELTYTIIDE